MRKDEYNVLCKRCTDIIVRESEKQNGGFANDRTRNTQQNRNSEVLASNVETVADVWKDRELLPASEGRPTIPTDGTDEKL